MINKKTLKKAVALILIAVMLTSLCACTKTKKPENPDISIDFPGRVNTFEFSAQPSETVNFTAESAKNVSDTLAQLKIEYPLVDIYDLEEVKRRLDFDASVQNHQYSALNGNGVLTADSLYNCVIANNKVYIEDSIHPTYTLPDDEYTFQICEFIVRVIDIMHQKYPDIDWQRVYCNLGNLKIFYDNGMMSYAQVNEELVLSISQNNSTIILNMSGKGSFGKVLTHEIMHIIQIGCTCEKIENCIRRAGISVYWDDYPMNLSDWTWMVEGSAERHMCNITGEDAITYQYKMDYLCSMTMSVLLRDSVKADTMETVCFADDPQILFDTFGCETEEEREELLNLMVTMQIMQMQPDDFFEEYKAKTGIDLVSDTEKMNQFCYSLKPAVCLTLAKEFYENLVPFLQENQLTYNDLFFLINLFEGHLNQHLTFNSTEKSEINNGFFETYNVMRSALFDALAKDNPECDIYTMYDEYSIYFNGPTLLNAELAVLPAEKREFLAERAEWQAELLALGVKVPQ